MQGGYGEQLIVQIVTLRGPRFAVVKFDGLISSGKWPDARCRGLTCVFSSPQASTQTVWRVPCRCISKSTF